MRQPKSDISPLKLASLEERGPEAVRVLLAQSPGPGAGALVRGLGSKLEESPSRLEAEQWLARKDAERERREAFRHRITWAIATAAAVVALLGWLFPFK
jgi:hypothetical protein